MLSDSRFSRGFISSLLIVALSAVAFADTIRLKDGSRIKGKIISFKDNRFVVEMGTGARRKELTVAAAEIESIQFDSGTQPQLTSDPNRNTAYQQPQTVADDPVAATPAATPQKKVFKRIDPSVPTSVALKTPGEMMRPVEWEIKVKADDTANGWTNSGWVVKKGQRIKIVGEGMVSLGAGHSTTASGLSTLNDAQKLLKNVPTGALVAVIGDDNNDFIYIGAEREFTASRDGALFLGINEGKLDDNSGAFDVKVAILPTSGE
jgi:hypothetical protein